MSLTPNFKYLEVQGKAYRNQSFMHMLGCTIPKQVLSQVMDLYVFSQIVRLLCLSCQVVSRTSESIIEVRAVIQDRTAAMVALSICVCDSPIGVRFCASQHEGLKPLYGIGASISDDMWPRRLHHIPVISIIPWFTWIYHIGSGWIWIEVLTQNGHTMFSYPRTRRWFVS